MSSETNYNVNKSRETKAHVNQSPDDIIHELGGCGRYQLRMALIVHIMKIVVCWSSMSMIFVTATPKWWCADEANLDGNLTIYANVSTTKSCSANGSKCQVFGFDEDMRTIVSEVGENFYS